MTNTSKIEKWWSQNRRAKSSKQKGQLCICVKIYQSTYWTLKTNQSTLHLYHWT